MCYNAGELRSMNRSNSIFNKKEILEYLDTDAPYPLPWIMPCLFLNGVPCTAITD